METCRGAMNKTILITILLVIIGAMLIGAGIGYWQHEEAKGWEPELYDKYGQEIDVDHLILCMEQARESHQQFLDMPPVLELGPITINEPARYYLNRISPYTTLEDQQEWVNIYDQVLGVLRSKQ